MKQSLVTRHLSLVTPLAAFIILHSSFSIAAAAAAAQEGVQLWEGGPFWADRNVGAEEPWEAGYYFWCGDTVGYKWENGKWAASDGSTNDFSFAKKVDYIPTFGISAAEARRQGWTTEENRTAPKHDAARVHWGGEWRIPTRQELIDLSYNKCDWIKAETNGVKGFVVRGRGDYANASIFVPFAGFANYKKRDLWGKYGHFYASDPRMDQVPGIWRLTYGSNRYVFYHWDRFTGMSVRPVRGDPGPFVRHGYAAGMENKDAEIKPSRPGCAPEEIFVPAPGEPAAQKGVRLWEGGPLWADRNVGAEKPSDYGWFFAWGSTRGYVYDWKIRHWASVDGTDPRAGFDQSHATSFGKDSENLRNEGLTTADDVLAPEHDAARANWGGPWRMPTKQEMEDLRDKCDWTWTTNGVKGFVVRGRDDYADAAIFLPATGFGIEEKWWARESGGYLWSSGPYLEGPNADCSWRLHFTSRGIGTDYCWDRHIGTPARPVRD